MERFSLPSHLEGSMRFALLLLLPLAGCTDESLAPPTTSEGGVPVRDGATSGDGLLTNGDLAMTIGDGPMAPVDGPVTTNADLSTRADLSGAPQTITCGGMACDVPLLACCSATYGITGTCGSANAGCANLQSLKFLCDGDEDCSNNQVCCFHPQGGSQCEKSCNAIGTREMCHDNKVCGNANCCSLGLNTPYMACMNGNCPF
jgi:hypothetical protein